MTFELTTGALETFFNRKPPGFIRACGESGKHEQG